MRVLSSHIFDVICLACGALKTVVVHIASARKTVPQVHMLFNSVGVRCVVRLVSAPAWLAPIVCPSSLLLLGVLLVGRCLLLRCEGTPVVGPLLFLPVELDVSWWWWLLRGHVTVLWHIVHCLGRYWAVLLLMLPLCSHFECRQPRFQLTNTCVGE